MDDTIVLSSDTDDSDVEIIGSNSPVMTKADLPPLSAVKVEVDDASVNLAKMSVKIEDTRRISPELNIFKRLNSFSRPVVHLTESHSETDPQTVTPVHATTVRLSQPPFLQRPETEPSSLGFSLPPLTGRAQTLSQDGHKTTVASNRPLIDSSQVESSQVIESQVSGWLEGNWELAGGILFAQLSQGLKVSPHQGSSKNRSLLRTSSPSAAGDRSASNGFCSPEQLQTEQADSASLRITGQPKRTPHSGHARPDANSEWQLEKVLADDSSNLLDPSHCDAAVQPQLSASDIKDTDQGSSTHGSSTHGSDVDLEEPSYFFWQDASYDEQNGEESRFESEPRSVSPDDTAFVCPAALSKLMSGQAQSLLREMHWQDEDQATAVVLPKQSLSLVYITIDENCTEGTLELLSDLLQPGFYPPTDISAHLVRGVLLDPHCPYHLCVQAFKLLIRTQRYHFVDKATVPWDWELLNTVMVNQDGKKKLKSSVVGMFLEYVVQTLEDDFHVKSSVFAQSIAKATLSCNHQFSHVRDVLTWLFTAISKSTEQAERPGAAREMEEQMRIVSVFQRMLSLALEVDRCPTLHSTKVSQELFHMLVGTAIPRAHRMLLLESLQSTVLTYKLVIHLLDYACPLKTSLPMSLDLLLYFMTNCTLALDSKDGTERWKRWEELVQLLWMLLLSYKKAMKGFLSGSTFEQRGSVSTYRGDDLVSRSAVREAGEAFLSRSRADVGQMLPPHVEEAFGNLQDYLLEICQC